MSGQAGAAQAFPVGIVGCGNIFERYVTGLRRLGGIDIAWCADLDEKLAESRAQEFGIPTGGSPADALAGKLGRADIVVNLTPPAAHADVSRATLLAGKHVYVEKPLAATPADAAAVLSLAAECDLRVGGAPDWVLGETARAAREAVAAGRIGEPVAVSAFATHSKVEQWHPNPGIFFGAGGGPVLDIGPYYVSALADCLGPIKAVAALERIGSAERPVTAPGRVVDSIKVEVATHACALLQFASGVLGTLTLSFDAWERTMPFIEIYGTEGTLSLPMPHERDGDLKVKQHGDDEWTSLGTDNGSYARGIGVVDMAAAIQAGRPHRATGTAAFHVLDVLTALSTASAQQRFVPVTSTP